MNSLPVEITADILSRLETGYLLHYRFVCKTWYNIISNPSFLAIHVNHNPPPCVTNLFVVHSSCDSDWENPLCFIENLEEGNNIQIIPITSFKNFKFPLTLSLSSSMSMMISQSVVIGSCNGLVCLSAISVLPQFIIPCNPFYILNPITRDYQQLPGFVNLQCSKVFSGFGFDFKRQKFKVVLMAISKEEDGSLTSEVLVHILGSCNWRRRKVSSDVPNAMFEAYQVNSSALINESLHWITIDSSSSSLKIVAFDVGSEEFGFVSTPETLAVVNSTDDRECISENFSVLVVENCLSAVDCSSKRVIDMWLMRKYNVKESWEKVFTLQKETLWASPCTSILPLKIQKNGELLHIRDDRHLVSYDPKNNKGSLIKSLKNEKLWNPSVQVFPIVPSVISPKLACICR